MDPKHQRAALPLVAERIIEMAAEPDIPPGMALITAIEFLACFLDEEEVKAIGNSYKSESIGDFERWKHFARYIKSIAPQRRREAAEALIGP